MASAASEVGDAMQLTSFNGLSTVGGVQLLLSSGGGSLLFDLGVVRNPGIAPAKVLFNDFVQPRPSDPLRDLLRAGMAPPVAGLYRTRDDGDPAWLFRARHGVREVSTPGEDGTLAVFFSHVHDDHMGLLPFVAPDVGIHVSAETGAFHDALVAAGEVPAAGAPLRPVADGDTFSVGDLVVEPVPIDHDIPGCAGLIARDGDVTLAYTGDWRGHGSHPKLVEAFIERCRAAGVDILVTEASTVTGGAPRPSISEHELRERFDRQVATAEGLVTLGFAPRNVERVAALAEISARHDRQLVVRPATARILQEVGWGSEYLVPDGLLADSQVLVLASPEDGAEQAVDQDWTMVDVATVAAHREAFVCEIRADERYLWLDLDAGAGDVHVHANGEPFGTTDPVWPTLETWTHQLGMELVVVDSHGHALPEDLRAMVREIAPDVVIPVHTNAPTSFPSGAYEVLLPTAGETIELPTGT